jgi:4,5-DOPA dioxygenase extradiol
MATLPSVFVSHGSPTLALDPGSTGPALAKLAASLPRPGAVLVASAHWETPRPSLTAALRPKTIHDFSGFPPPLYELRYPAPGAPAVATRARELLAASGFEAALDPGRGLDHGAWVPLRFMYPDADVPVAQVSIQPALGPEHHRRLGAALAPLASEGVLIVGSGSATHNLGEVQWRARENEGVPAWVQEFRAWLVDALARRDVAGLVDYRTRAPHAVRNHPTDEHLLPLYVALGAAGPEPTVAHVHDDVTFGVLGMDVFVMRPSRPAERRAA